MSFVSISLLIENQFFKLIYQLNSKSTSVSIKKKRKIDNTEDDSVLDDNDNERGIEEIKTSKKRTYVKTASKWTINNQKNVQNVPNTSDFVNYMVNFSKSCLRAYLLSIKLTSNIFIGNPLEANDQKLKLYSKLVDNVKIINKNYSNIDFNSKLNLYTRNNVDYNNLSFFNKYIDKSFISKENKNKNFSVKIHELNYLKNANEHYHFLLKKWNQLKDVEDAS